MQPRARKRRERLISSAARRIHRHGYCRTSLVDVAKSAGVPVGGVYYYFKTKEALVHAIAEMRLRELESLFDGWASLPGPKSRLRALVNVWRDDSEIDARYGCPLGSLCYELAKAGGAAAKAAAVPLTRIREWSEKQFAEHGVPDAKGMAEHLTMALQGASLLANALRDPDALMRETERLNDWIDGM